MNQFPLMRSLMILTYSPKGKPLVSKIPLSGLWIAFCSLSNTLSVPVGAGAALGGVLTPLGIALGALFEAVSLLGAGVGVGSPMASLFPEADSFRPPGEDPEAPSPD